MRAEAAPVPTPQEIRESMRMRRSGDPFIADQRAHRLARRTYPPRRWIRAVP